ncbi:MAG: hypothetical protein ACJ72N_04690 [Labedaea sp.]
MITWWCGLMRWRWGRLVATATGIATAVALLTALGQFLLGAQAAMTAHALRAVSVDWQVQVAAGADPAAVLRAVTATPSVTAALPVEFATTPVATANRTGQLRREPPGRLRRPGGWAAVAARRHLEYPPSHGVSGGSRGGQGTHCLGQVR